MNINCLNNLFKVNGIDSLVKGKSKFLIKNKTSNIFKELMELAYNGFYFFPYLIVKYMPLAFKRIVKHHQHTINRVSYNLEKFPDIVFSNSRLC